MTMLRVRLLSNVDRADIDTFLSGRPETTMILRSNLLAEGLRDEGLPFQGTYAGAFNEAAVLCGVAACYWNGNVIFESDGALPELVRVSCAGARREADSLLGAAEQVEAAMQIFEGMAIPFDSTEALLSLDLDDLTVLAALERGQLNARIPARDELDLIVEWRMDFLQEAMNAEWSKAVEAARRTGRLRACADKHCWSLFDQEQPVAFSAFNAQVPDCVQIGGVWTPPELRGR